MATDLSAPLPQIDLAPNSLVTVDVGSAGAVITQLVVHGWQQDAGGGAGGGGTIQDVEPLWLPVPNSAVSA